MKNRTGYIGTALLVFTALAACTSATQLPPSPTPMPSTPTSIPPKPTSPPPTSTLALPTARPTTPPIAITTLEEMLGEDMVGAWFVPTPSGSELLFEFLEDGRIFVSGPGIGTVAIDIWFEGGLFHISDDIGDCSDDQIGKYEVHGVPGEYVYLTIVEEPCEDRPIKGKWKEVLDS